VRHAAPRRQQAGHQDVDGNSSKRKILVLIKDPGVLAPPLPAVPRTCDSAAHLRLRNPLSGETVTLDLPAGSGWKGARQAER
jgi:hypothetical protein